MAFFKIPNVRIAGLAVGVPAKIINNLTTSERISSEYDNESFVRETGVLKRRVDQTLTTSDLCFAASKRLLNSLNWSASDIDAIIFVSQTHDYLLPATACIIQDRLGCRNECFAEDIQLGCSGWVYGLCTTSKLFGQGDIKKALLMAGDGRNHYIDESNSDPLFGFAGTVTALEFDETAEPMFFHLGTDGSGYDAIIMPGGGARNPISLESFKNITREGGKSYNDFVPRMNGMDVFSFGISTAPKSVKKLADRFGFDYLDSDYLVLHQANIKMNEKIVKKLKYDNSRAPESLSEYGNTSSASIPLTIVARLKDNLIDNRKTLICCGFGVGLSWGSCKIVMDRPVIIDPIEVGSCENML